jgi:hypothetical protein
MIFLVHDRIGSKTELGHSHSPGGGPLVDAR